ncbi:MAG TPA: acyl-CoA dehydrogenase family protein, partial [Gaiellaceae bacterium]|nr:acyl-CoA dehydrogenase family protein [Gaiellaceae bacterium]
MDLRDTPEEAEFRAGLRAWIDANLPEDKKGGRGGAQRFDDPFVREWSRKLYEAGYAGLTWPKEYGGAGAPYSFQAIFYEEMAAAQAPPHVGVIGLGMAGPTIIAHGSEEQKARYLQPLLAAEEIWCQGFSEPDAGSDLAAARTRAERRGESYVVNGQKVWSSFAHIADFCILVARSDPEAPRYRNLTYLIVDMHAPGVEVRPLRQITGEAEFNEIFFSDVEVPVANRLGEEGEGWQVAMTTLLHERGTLGFALTATLDAGVTRLLADARERANGDPGLRERVAREWIELQALRYTNYRALGTYQRTGVPGPEGSGVKLRWSEANQRMTKLARELHG